MPKLQVNGIEMYYEIHGEGEPLIFLHGFAGSNKSWNEYIPHFEKDFQVITISQRGHGQSTNPTNKFTHRQSAYDVYALLDQLEAGLLKAVGYSSGGMTLLHMATQQPERITDMVLMAATPYYPQKCRDIQSLMLEPEWDEMWTSFIDHHTSEEQLAKLRRQFYEFKDSYDDMNFTPPLISTIKTRTLIIHGDRDPFFPIDIPITLYKSIPNSYLWIMPNTSHGVEELPNSCLIKTLRDFFTYNWETDI
jgi:pimeloyl-ACP methyl ester carboxylesterase